MSQPPKPSEAIYLSPSSVLPVLTAVGIAGIVVGLYAWWPYSVVGAIVAIPCLIGWLRGNRRAIAAMPTRQQTDTGPIPLSGRE